MFVLPRDLGTTLHKNTSEDSKRDSSTVSVWPTLPQRSFRIEVLAFLSLDLFPARFVICSNIGLVSNIGQDLVTCTHLQI